MPETSLLEIPANPTPDDTAVDVCCVAGLGNPGARYRDTPHNIGFMVVDEIAKRYGIRIDHREGQTLTGAGRIAEREVLLAKPQTFMNHSGAGLHAVLERHRLNNRNLLVVYDELDLPWTALRIKKSGSSAGHNGIKSIIAALRTDYFTRVRIGIHPGRDVDDAAEYVLAPFGREFRDDLTEVVAYTADAVECIIAEGAAKAMAKFNRRARGSEEEE